KAKHADLLAHLTDSVRHQQLAHPCTLEGRPESLDERDAPALADRPEARLDAMALAASAVLLSELAPLIADEVLGSASSAGHRGVEQSADVGSTRRLSKHLEAHNPSREVVHNRHHMPAEGPQNRPREGQRRTPQAAPEGH